MARRLTDAEVRARLALIAELREQNVSLNEAARRCGISRDGLVTFLRFHNIVWERQNLRWTQEEHDLAVRLRREGKSWPAIAKAVGGGEGALEQYARAKFPDDVRPGAAKPRADAPQIVVVGGDARERLLALLQSGMAVANAARVTGFAEDRAAALAAEWRAEGSLPPEEPPAPVAAPAAPQDCRRFLSLRARVGEAKAMEQWRYERDRALRRQGEARA